MTQTIELAVFEGSSRRRVTLEADGDGLQVNTEDRGDVVKMTFGAESYAFTTSVSGDHMRALAMAALGDLLTGNLNADVALKALCDRHAIPYRFNIETNGFAD
jgi:UDP-N-acetylmuramyl pentapeptide synthase